MIRFNNLFTSYRRETSGNTRRYASSATITNGLCYLQSLDGATKDVLGVDNSVEAYVLTTDETDLERTDKLVIGGSNYYIIDLRKQHADGAFKLTRAVIKLKET